MQKIRQLLGQIMKNVSVGTFCFFIDYFGLIFLTEWGVCSYFTSSAISYTVSIIINYLLSMRFVFKGREEMSKILEIIIFAALSLVGLGLTQLVMWIAVESLGFYYMLAKVFSSMIVTTYNFISRKMFLEE